MARPIPLDPPVTSSVRPANVQSIKPIIAAHLDALSSLRRGSYSSHAEATARKIGNRRIQHDEAAVPQHRAGLLAVHRRVHRRAAACPSPTDTERLSRSEIVALSSGAA